MTSILKGLAALAAVLTVNLGGAHVGMVNRPTHHSVAADHSVTAPKTTADATTDPVGSDAYQMRGRTQVTVIPPTPALAEAPADRSPAANQPLAQLPIAAPPPRRVLSRRLPRHRSRLAQPSRRSSTRTAPVGAWAR